MSTSAGVSKIERMTASSFRAIWNSPHDVTPTCHDAAGKSTTSPFVYIYIFFSRRTDWRAAGVINHERSCTIRRPRTLYLASGHQKGCPKPFTYPSMPGSKSMILALLYANFLIIFLHRCQEAQHLVRISALYLLAALHLQLCSIRLYRLSHDETW